MDVTHELRQQILEMLNQNRAQCAWFWRRDFVPASPEEMRRVLTTIARRADRATYQRAMTLLHQLPAD